MNITPGILNAMQRSPAFDFWHTCTDCKFGLPKYPGRYPKLCPACGCDLSCQDGYPGNAVAESAPLSLSEHTLFTATLAGLAARAGCSFVGVRNGRAVLALKTGVREEPRVRLECKLEELSAARLKDEVVAARAALFEKYPALSIDEEEATEDMIRDPRFKKPIPPNIPKPPEGTKALNDEEPEGPKDVAEAAPKRYCGSKAGKFAQPCSRLATVEAYADGKFVGYRCAQHAKRFGYETKPIEGAPPPTAEPLGEAEGKTAFKSAVAMVIRDRLSRASILIGRSTAKDARSGLWCFPAGKIDDGEDPEDAAVRETWEETGVTAKKTGTLIRHPEYPHIAFIVLDYADGPLSPNNEFEELKWLAVKDAWEHPDLFGNCESLIQRMSGEIDVVERVATRGAGVRSRGNVVGEAAGTAAKPTSAVGRSSIVAGSSAPRPKPETAGSTFRQSAAATQPKPKAPPEPDEREAKKLDLPEPASDGVEAPGEEGQLGEEDAENGEDGVAPGEAPGLPAPKPGPKRIDLRFSDASSAEKAEQWLRSVKVDVEQSDGFTVSALAKDPTDLEIITRTAEALGLKLAGAA